LQYRVVITITGSNFDSIGYVGVLAIVNEEEPGVGPLKSLSWIERPKRL
jgi:hypothetical protein